MPKPLLLHQPQRCSSPRELRAVDLPVTALTFGQSHNNSICSSLGGFGSGNTPMITQGFGE